MEDLVTGLRTAVISSKGWWTRIAADSGCRVRTLRRIAGSRTYDPPLSEAHKIWRWFVLNGVKTKGPQGRRSQECRESAPSVPSNADS